MPDEYYVRIRGRVAGPFDESRLAQLAQRGQLGRAHELSEDGASWFPAAKLEHLFPKRATDNGTLGSDKRRGAASTGVERAAPARREDAASGGSAQWYYSKHGEKSGPLSWDELKSLFRQGALPSSTLVWSDGMTEWVRCDSVPGLVQQSSEGAKPIPWSELLPVSLMATDGSWSFAWVQCLAVAVLFPLLILEYHGSSGVGLTTAAATFTLYFTLIWTGFFHWCINPRAVSNWRLAGVWLMTATLGIVLVVTVELLLLPLFADAMVAETEASLLKRVVGWTVAVGLVEEAGKMFAVLAFTRSINTENVARTCAFIGIVSGLAFGTVEAVQYTHAYAEQHSQGQTEYGDFLVLLMTRWISLPLLHAIWAGITGYFIGLSHVAQGNRWRWVLFGLLTASVLHGLYDVGAGEKHLSWLSLVVAAVSLGLLVGYLRSEEALTTKVAAYRSSSA